jgi:hypothetical protein
MPEGANVEHAEHQHGQAHRPEARPVEWRLDDREERQDGPT